MEHKTITYTCPKCGHETTHNLYGTPERITEITKREENELCLKCTAEKYGHTGGILWE